MTIAESARSEQPIETMQKHPNVLLHELNAASDRLTSGRKVSGDAVNFDVCLSDALACDNPNRYVAAETLDVQVFVAMKKA